MKILTKLMMLSAALSVTTACGDPLNDNNFEGEPLVTIDGTVQSIAPQMAGGTTYVALAWGFDTGNGDEISSQITPVQSTTFPASFSLAVTSNPRDDQLQDYSVNKDGSEGYMGSASIFIGEDVDGDGAISPLETEDNALAVSDSHVLLFVKGLSQTAKDRLQGNYILNTEDLQEGFNLAEFVCNTTGGDFDHLRVVPNTRVNVRSLVDVIADDFPCMNIE